MKLYWYSTSGVFQVLYIHKFCFTVTKTKDVHHLNLYYLSGKQILRHCSTRLRELALTVSYFPSLHLEFLKILSKNTCAGAHRTNKTDPLVVEQLLREGLQKYFGSRI